ncbi:MAG TPA: FecR family protein [Terriglobales bacterium]|nr:FecR family protein [Terriglobales bacterium]
MRPIRALFVALVVLLAAGLPAAQTPEPATLVAGSATIDDIKGEVTVQPPNAAAAKPQRGQVLAPETILEIRKGSALLHLEDGSQVLIRKNSRVVVKAPEGALARLIDLLLGRVYAKVRKRTGSAPSFRMGTPTAVITVRGTEFDVSVNEKGKTRVEVHDGLVAVASLLAPDRPVLLRPGFHTTVQRDQLPERPDRSYLFDDDQRRTPGRESERGERDSERQGTEKPEDPD